MGALPIPEPIGLRYAPYIQELREFFAFSGLKFGSPDDVFAVIERIQTSPAFAEDLSSLVRAAILREGGSMPQGQLLEILAVAVGGTEMEHAPQTDRQPLRQLLAFIAGVLRRPWNLPPGERSEVLSFPSDLQLPADEPSAAAAVADAGPVTESPAAAPIPTAPAVAPIEAVSPALAPLAAAAFAHPDPPGPQPVSRPILREAFALRPVLATDLPPAPPKPKPQPPPPTLEVRFEPPVDSPPDAGPDPLPPVARSLEPAPPPETAAAYPPTNPAEHRSPTSAPWVSSHRPRKHPDSQVDNPASPVQKAPDSLVDPPPTPPAVPPPEPPAWRKRIPQLSRSMHEVVTVGAVAAVIAVLVAVALRPGSSLQSETVPVSSPDLSPYPSADPATSAPTPVPLAAEPAKPTANGPELAIPAGAARKPHSGTEYVAPPTARYYNGWGPAAGQPAANQPVSGTPIAAASAPAGPAAATGPAESAAPIERRTEVLRTHTADVDGQHYFAVPSSAMAANLVSAPRPEYPLMARIAHVEGEVVVEAVIDRDGTVSATHVIRGHRLLRGAAVSALRRRRYRPYRVDGRAVDVATTLAVNVTPRK